MVLSWKRVIFSFLYTNNRIVQPAWYLGRGTRLYKLWVKAMCPQSLVSLSLPQQAEKQCVETVVLWDVYELIPLWNSIGRYILGEGIHQIVLKYIKGLPPKTNNQMQFRGMGMRRKRNKDLKKSERPKVFDHWHSEWTGIRGVGILLRCLR